MADSSFPISGQIDPKAFPFLLMDLHRQGATGSLKVEGPSYQKALYYRAGRILFGSSNDPRDQLGAILIEGGKITPEQLEDVNAKVGPGNPLAKVLSESGFVSQRELGEAARTKVERILSDVIAYDSGAFEFEDGVLPKGAVDLKLSTEKLVLAAVRRVADRNFVLRHLGGLDVVLSPAAELNALLEEIRTDAGGLADHLDGRRTLKEAAGLTRLEEFDAAKVACALLFLGLVSPSRAAAGDSDLDLAATARMAFAADEPEPTVVMAAPAESGAPADSEAEPFFVSDAAPAFAPPAAAPTFGLEEEESPAASEPESAVFTPPPFEPPAPEPEPPPEPAPMIEAEAELPTQILPAPPASPSPPPAVMVSSPGASGVRSSLPLIPPPPRTATPREAPASIPAIVMPPPPAASRPSKEDLAALDALLNARTIEGPLEPLERERPASPARNWEPKFAQPQRGHAPERRLSPIVLAAAAFLVLGAGGAGAWFYMKRPDSRTAAASPTTPPRTPATAPTTTLAATATSSPAPAATPGATPAVPSPAPAAAGTPSPVPAATPQQSAKPDVPPAKGGALADARGLMQKGSIPQAAQAFAAHLRSAPSAFSVQILVACSTETVTKAVESVSAPELYVLPVNFKGRDCYRLCWGLYESEARAGGALRSVPDYFRKGGATPKVVPTATLLP